MAGSIVAGRTHANRMKKFYLAQDTEEGRELRAKAILDDQATLEAMREVDDPPEEHIQPINISLPHSIPTPPTATRRTTDHSEEHELQKPAQQRSRPLRAAAARHTISPIDPTQYDPNPNHSPKIITSQRGGTGS
ncbi:hypothetical protein M422DRAFT_256492 [Sphaerobolus stellatus SS14]|uniref:Uncharacterized protein n=1 Tax=Sphaerobolus stellatus (strain SS14) TaxID=990650 RepID=A0A0C9VRD6_SPHS4|nr:hypothetical protein M422DRAFT_256492 [Sphaerobolus stellatus SS14]